MTTTMVIVASRTGARLLTLAGPGKPLQTWRELQHPEGRLMNREVNADRPGRVHDRVGPARHAMAKEEPPHERSAADFAREVAQATEEARNAHAFDDVVLVAEPGFLGMLRQALDAVTNDRVRGTVQKDLAAVETRDLAPYLEEVLPVG